MLAEETLGPAAPRKPTLCESLCQLPQSSWLIPCSKAEHCKDQDSPRNLGYSGVTFKNN